MSNSLEQLKASGTVSFRAVISALPLYPAKPLIR